MSTNLQPTNGLPKPFKAAKLFEDIGLWTKLCVLTKEAGGHVDKTAEEFVKTGLIKIRHKVAFKSNKTDVKFPHSKSRDSYRNHTITKVVLQIDFHFKYKSTMYLYFVDFFQVQSTEQAKLVNIFQVQIRVQPFSRISVKVQVF